MAQLKDSLITGDLRVTGTIYGNVPLNDLVDADDLKAIEELTGTSGWLKKTAANTWTLGTFAASDIPNIDASKITSGTLPIARGGTGLTSSPSMLTNLGSTTAANVLQASPRPGVTGTLGAANGGTGKTTLKDAANALINALDTGSSNLTANDYVITQYVGGGTTTTTYHRRPASALRVGGLLTARTFTIGSTGKTFDGTGNVSWTLAEIGAAAGDHNHDSTYLKLSGGTMTGGITFPSDSSAYTTKGIVYAAGSKIGENTSGGLGIYAAERIYLRPSSGTSSSGDGVEISTSGLYPTNNNSETLGTSSNKWSNVYATTFTGALSGNATSATGFASAKTIALTGNVTGSATGGNGSNGWSIATTIGSEVVTNAMLAGSIANGKLVNSKVTIAGNDVSLGGSLAAATLKTSLGLNSAMHYIGKATVAITDGSTTDPKISGNATTLVSGDVVIDSGDSREYVWNGSKWELLGGDSSYKVTQTAVTDAAYSGSDTATTFVSAVTQNTNGEITVTKRKLPTYNNYSHPTGDGNKHVPANGTSNNGKFLQATATAGTYQWASLPTASTTGAGIIQIGTDATNAAAGNHTHGNIANGGTLGTASRIVITDSNKKITTASYAHLNTSAGTTSANGYDELVLGNSTASGTAGNTFGRIALYSTGTTGQYIIAVGSGWKNHVLPDSAGWIATGGNGSSTGVGNSTTPIYLSTSGVLTAGTALKALAYKDSLTASDVGAATSGHTHATSITTSSGTNQITLALGTKYAITAGGTSYVFTMPANPNTDIKQNITLKTTTKGYITAVETAPTGTAAAQAGIADTGVYLTTTAGQINATSYKVAETALILYNTTTGCIEITT